jgi:hypothetical protein
VRFPVSVLVTKCDLLNGFREFFDDLKDPAAQHQMMGWSNPDPLDAPFRVELVDAHIHTVVERLRRRRLGLMIDPVERSAPRRVDEVDRLFSLPHSVELVAPSLRQYLEAIFIPSAWSVQPLFLRGIYFMSSLREGSSLDQELANALGRNVETLEDEKFWERDRSYFLRDVFLEKTFRERGLVTRASNTKQLVMKRRLTVLGTGVAGVAALFTLLGLGYSSFRNSLGGQAGHWARAADGWKVGNTWMPIVSGSGDRYAYHGAEPVGGGSGETTKAGKIASALFRDQEKPLTGFQSDLVSFSQKPPKAPLIFRILNPFGGRVDPKKVKTAQRVVFEGGVVKPLLDATRAKMIDTGTDAKPPKYEGDALVGLIGLEANIVRRIEGRPVDLTGSQFLKPLALYTTGTEAEPEAARALDRTYGEGGGGANQWPPSWFTGKWTLDENVAIKTGLERFVNDATNASKEQQTNLGALNSLIAELRKYEKREEATSAAARPQNAPEDEIHRIALRAFEDLNESKQSLDTAMRIATENGIFGDGAISLAAAYDRLVGAIITRYETAKKIQEYADEILAAAQKPGAPEPESRRLFREIAAKLKGVMAELDRLKKSGLPETNRSELEKLDAFYLTDAAGKVPEYQIRWQLYRECIVVVPDPRSHGVPELIGKEWQPLIELLAKIDAKRTEVNQYKGALSERAALICNYCLTNAERVNRDEFTLGYIREGVKRLQGTMRFPLVWDPLGLALKDDKAFLAAAKDLRLIERDLQVPMFLEMKPAYRVRVADFGRKLAALKPVREALVTREGNIARCEIWLPNQTDQFRMIGEPVGYNDFGAVIVRAGTISHGGVSVTGSPTAQPTKSASELRLGEFLIDQPFHFHFNRNVADKNIAEHPAYDMPAPENWTALRLLTELDSRPADDRGARWRVQLPLPANKRIAVELRFTNPLPPFETWPKAKEMQLEVPVSAKPAPKPLLPVPVAPPANLPTPPSSLPSVPVPPVKVPEVTVPPVKVPDLPPTPQKPER